MHSLANSEDASSDCSKRHSRDCYWRNERKFYAASGGEQGSTVAAPIPLEVLRKKTLKQKKIFTPVFWIPDVWVFFLLRLINDHAQCNKGSLIFSPQSPSRGETYYVTEIFSPLFFNLDVSLPIPFILSYLDSLRIDVCWPRMTKALVNSTGGWREHAVPHVLFNIPCLQYSDTKCQLWYFLHLGY